MKLHAPDRLHAIGAKAKPGRLVRTGLLSHRWDAAGNCSRPYVREIMAHPLPNIVGSGISERGASPRIEVHVPCRKCPACLAARSRLWAARARFEIKRSARTWFGTLTLAPEYHMRTLSAARQAAARLGEDFECFDQSRQFVERHKIVSAEITKYLKRLRKDSGAAFKYLLVAEPHKSGLPHYHILVHEVSQWAPVTRRQLQDNWACGFSRWKLVDNEKPAGYVAKYLSKTIAARVRASIGYGKE